MLTEDEKKLNKLLAFCCLRLSRSFQHQFIVRIIVWHHALPCLQLLYNEYLTMYSTSLCLITCKKKKDLMSACLLLSSKNAIMTV